MKTQAPGTQILTFIGLAVLSLMVIALYTLTTVGAWQRHLALGALMTLITAAVVAALVREGRTLGRDRGYAILSKAALFDAAGVVGGAWATYVLSVELELGPVVASALVGLLGGLVLPAQGAAIYCGSFAGMSSAALLANGVEMLAAGIVAGVVYVLANGTLSGFGGKLGTTAFVGTVVTGLGLGRIFAPAPMPAPPLALHIILTCIAAALLTYWLSRPLKHGPVIGSSVVGLVGGLLLPALAPEAGPLLAVAAFCASFTGMSGAARLPAPPWMTVAGLITGIVFVLSLPVLGGAGGKLGTIAMGAATATWALRLAVKGETAARPGIDLAGK
jgi:hypothetical protein